MMFNGSHEGLLKTLRILFSVLIICLSLLFMVELYSLNLLSSQLFMLAALLILLLDAGVVAGLNFFTKQKKAQITCSVLVVALSLGYGIGSWYIAKTNGTLTRLTVSNDQVKNVINVYSMKDSDLNNVDNLQDKTIGVLKSINTSGTKSLVDDLSAKGIHVTEKEYTNFGPLVDGLYNGEVNAIVVNEMYLPNITDLDGYQDFLDKTKIAYQYVYYTDVSMSTAAVSNITTEPFTVMVNGSDSRYELGDKDRSDVNMLVTINPMTQVALLVSIPRDSYVETVCDPEYDCQQGQYDKLTHTGLHTYNTTQRTIENFMDVDINYVFRANFSAVVDMVDALGGIDVNVAPGYAVDYFYTNDLFGTDYGVHEGINHLNGQAALLYARERYAYKEGDFQRIKNQSEVLTEIAKKAASPEIIVRYTALLDAIDGNFWTDLSQNEIMDFIKYNMAESPDWTFIQYSLTGTSDSLYCAESYGNASVVVLDQNSVQTAHDLINAVKDGESAEQIQQMIDAAAGLPADYTLTPKAVSQSDPAEDSSLQMEAGVNEMENSGVDPSQQAGADIQQPIIQQPVVQDPVLQEPVYTPPAQEPTYQPEYTPPVQEPVITPPVVDTPVTNPVTPEVPADTPVADPTPSVPETPVVPEVPVIPTEPAIGYDQSGGLTTQQAAPAAPAQ